MYPTSDDATFSRSALSIQVHNIAQMVHSLIYGNPHKLSAEVEIKLGAVADRLNGLREYIEA